MHGSKLKSVDVLLTRLRLEFRGGVGEGQSCLSNICTKDSRLILTQPKGASMVPPLKGNSRESLSAIKLKKIKKSSLEELDEFREVFRLVDRDDSGSITREELAEIFETIGIEATGEEIDRMMQEVDIDGSGSIEFEGEFRYLSPSRMR